MENKNKALLSRKLVELKSLMFQLKQKLETFILKKIDKEKLYDFLEKWNLTVCLVRVISHYGESAEKRIRNPKRTPRNLIKEYERSF